MVLIEIGLFTSSVLSVVLLEVVLLLFDFALWFLGSQCNS